jgi:hypothetical protein
MGYSFDDQGLPRQGSVTQGAEFHLSMTRRCRSPAGRRVCSSTIRLIMRESAATLEHPLLYFSPNSFPFLSVPSSIRVHVQQEFAHFGKKVWKLVDIDYDMMLRSDPPTFANYAAFFDDLDSVAQHDELLFQALRRAS